MADRFKKDSTPPPLLLMPAGGGLTLTPPDQPNVLMPVIQAAPSLLDPELEAEADSFVGQSSSPPPPINPTSSAANNGHPTPYFQSVSVANDPFAQVGPGRPPVSSVPTFVPSSVAPRTNNATPPPPGAAASMPPAALPLSSSVTTGSGNIYRQKGGRPQYAPPPQGPISSAPGQFSPMAPPSQLPPTAAVPPMNLPPTSNFPVSSGLPPMAAVPPMTSVSQPGEDNAQYTGGLYYTPVRHHWCYRQDQEGVEIWRPFSRLDSTQLEVAFSTRLQENPSNTVVLTNGGRYDVNVGSRVRTPIYWDETPTPVRRCSWFFKREGDNRYVPYEEEFSERLENEYKKAMETGGWHRRLDFPGNVVIVMHNANVIVQFPASAAPDEWGNIQTQTVYSVTSDQTRPRVVKRGVDDFATIELGERTEVDHLVFFVPGIEDMAEKKISVEVLVDEFRSNALSLMQSHFTQAFQSNTINRVEFLPIIWTKALQDGASEVKRNMGSVTLPSTSKLRHFVNNTLLDTLFYTSPIFCQNICETVGNEMNRIFHIFLERNQSFSGDVSVAGHSLGSVILFDILANQGQQVDPVPIAPPPTQQTQSLDDSLSDLNGEVNTEENNEEEVSLETLLSRVGLQDKVELFQQEQIDLESLIMCSEQDLKDIGLPMGPRKKLLGLLKEEQDRKDAKKREADLKKLQQELEKKEQEKRLTTKALQNTNVSNESGVVSGQYTQGQFGAGQLCVTYPQLDFTPSALFALGSPIAVFLALRGVQDIGEFFQLPTCPRVYNIFHPFDPMAYRLEPLIRPNTVTIKPVLVPHYKGRKRLHLEFKEAVTRYGTDIKQKIVDSFKSTWNSLNEFARAHTTGKPKTMETEVQSGMDEMMSHIARQQAEDDRASVSSMAEEDIHMGALNEGHRVDYVLQEGPLESFNDYLFALASHSCYWESEDTALLILKEIYAPLGVRPQMPGKDGGRVSREGSLPPRSAFPPSSQAPHTGPPPPSSAGSSAYNLGSPMAANTPPFQSPVNNMYGKGSATPYYQGSPAPAGPPPPMFTPPTMSSATTSPAEHPRQSPYVAPDFNNLPHAQAPGPAGPPPMGPAIAGGYRRLPPK